MEDEGQATNTAIENARAYANLEPEIRELITFKEFYEASRQGAHRKEKRHQNQEFRSKITLPNFDGSKKLTARAWLQKLNTYPTLSPMMEEDALQFVIMHLEGIAHDWWHHGLITQGHQNITSYGEFSQKLIKRFDRKHPQENFKKLTQLRQQGIVEDYIKEFQRIFVQVTRVDDERFTYFFIEGLKDSLKGLVSALKPSSLDDAFEMALRLEVSNTNNKSWHKPTIKNHNKDKSYKNFVLTKDREELKKKNLCFKCQEPWEPGHN